MFVSIALAGAFLIVLVLWEAFETIIFPRRVTRWVRLTRIFYRVTWRAWRRIVYLISSKHLRENLLSIYGPLSLIVLLSLWACTLIVGFARPLSTIATNPRCHCRQPPRDPRRQPGDGLGGNAGGTLARAIANHATSFAQVSPRCGLAALPGLSIEFREFRSAARAHRTCRAGCHG